MPWTTPSLIEKILSMHIVSYCRPQRSNKSFPLQSYMLMNSNFLINLRFWLLSSHFCLMKFQILRGPIIVWVLFIYISCLDPNILLHFGGKSRGRYGLVIFRLVKSSLQRKK